MNSPLVSIIVPTFNSSAMLENCLKSIVRQSYKHTEIIVVDKYSSDNTVEIAKKYTKQVFSHGPERSAQRNVGISKAAGELVAIIDSDMELTSEVIKACVETITSDPAMVGVVIPEESFGVGFWAQCKRLERSYYVGVPWMEAARFFRKNVFDTVGGYDVSMVSGEDWDLSQRAQVLGSLGRIEAFILHNEDRLSLFKTLQKKFYYARSFASYMDNTKSENMQLQTGIAARYKLFFNKPKKIGQAPHTWLGMLLMKTAEFGFGGMGYLAARLKKALTEE